MFHTSGDFVVPVANLFDLANTDFDPDAFKARCSAFAKFKKSQSFADLWYFSFGKHTPVMMVTVDVYSPVPAKVRFCVLSVCWWETWTRQQHPSEESYRDERKTFDRLYDQQLAHATSILGDPQSIGIAKNEQHFKRAIWRGTTGLLTLQQSAYDRQFGLDINYWVEPWSSETPDASKHLPG